MISQIDEAIFNLQILYITKARNMEKVNPIIHKWLIFDTMVWIGLPDYMWYMRHLLCLSTPPY